MKISNNFMSQPCFEFYIDLLRDMVNNRPPRYNIINSAGGRNCGKTYSFTLFVSLLFYYKVKKTGYTISSPTTTIICMGLYNAKGENIIKKGIAGSSRYTYAIK